MKVTLRERKKAKSISLYLDYYHKGKRKFEYLGLYLTPSPRSTQERIHNKKTRELAEKIRSKRLLEVQNDQFGFQDFEVENADFVAYFEKLAEKKYDSEGNHGNWISALKHLKNFAGGEVPFRRIDRKWVEKIKDYLNHEARSKTGDKLSTNTKVSYFNKIRAALRQATTDGFLKENPSRDVKPIKEGDTKREFLTLEELKAAANTECDAPVHKAAFIFSALTGLRFSDIQKLTWSEIQHSDEYGYYIRFQQKKTSGEETLPIPDDAMKFLGERQAPADKVFVDLHYSDKNNQRLQEWMRRAGIEKKITFHCARHTYATLQLTHGTDIYTVSKLLGHKSLKTTEIYAKIIDEKKREAVRKLKL